MTRKELNDLFFLTEKTKGLNNSDIILELVDKKIKGKIENNSFIYSIDDVEFIIPLGRIWNYILSNIKGNKKDVYLKNLNEFLDEYNLPEIFYSQLYYVNPENNELEVFVRK